MLERWMGRVGAIYRRLNERLMGWQGWVPERQLHELDARADRIIALMTKNDASTEVLARRLSGHRGGGLAAALRRTEEFTEREK